MQADLITQVVLPLAIFLIMFGIGVSLRISDFKEIFKRPKALVIGLIGQLILLPILALIITVVLKLPPEIAVGMIIIALVPGGTTSNMFTYLYRGDVSLSISLTVLASLMTPFTIPLFTAISISYFIGENSTIELPIIKTIIQLLVITIVPVLLGMFTLSRWPTFSKKIEVAIKWFSIAFILLIAVILVLKNQANAVSYFAQAGLAILILNLAALVIGYYLAKLAKLSHKHSVTMGFEVGIQNGTLAMVIAGTLIGNETMMIPAVIYSLLMFFTGAGFGWWINKKQSNKVNV